MRRVIGCVLLLLVLGFPAHAQAPPILDFGILSYLDYPRAGDVVRRSQFYLMGWAFECRSGLQPVTQRIGDVTVGFFQPGRGTVLANYQVFGSWERPDVAAAFRGACPAIGPYVGYGMGIANVPPAGVWTVTVAWATQDGAGRVSQHSAASTFTLIE